jgi:hypothetical protein
MTLKASPRWKEELVVTDEAGRTHVFDCGWGVDPPVVYVPSAQDWTGHVPESLAQRRDEVLDALRRTGHVLKEDLFSSD